MAGQNSTGSLLALAFLKAVQYGAGTALATGLISAGLAIWAQPDFINGVVMTGVLSTLAGAAGMAAGAFVGARRASRLLEENMRNSGANSAPALSHKPA